MVIPKIDTDDERLWAPISPSIWSRPLHLNTAGVYVHLLKFRRSGLLQRHSGMLHAYVLRGKWLCLEYDWVAETGGYAC